jgi:hypothetical protein
MEKEQMVKAFLGTSTLGALALALMGSSPAFGETLSSGAVAPSLKIDGFTAVNAYVVNQQRRENGKGGPQPHLGVDVSNLFFTIMGTSMSGLEYMYRVTLETIPNSGSIIDQNYVQIKSRVGIFQVGNNVGPEDTMIWDAGKIIGGTGGFDGGYSNVYNMSAGVMRGNDNIGDTGNATKIVYYSPDMMGWQFGVAYTPSTAHKGDGKLDNQTGRGVSKLPGNRGLYDHAGNQPFDLRNFAVGVTYKKEIGKWNITLSGAGIVAKSYFFTSSGAFGNSVGRVPFQNTKAYQLGFVMGYGDFRFGGGYLDNGKSHLPKNSNFRYGSSSSTVNLTSMNNGNAGHAWNLGAGYTMGAYQFGTSYQRTNRNTGGAEKAHSDFYSATVDVTPLQGLKAYAEVDYIRSRTNKTAIDRETAFLNNASSANIGVGNNSGLLGIIGTKVSF